MRYPFQSGRLCRQILFIGAAIMTVAAKAEITTDGSLGAVNNLTGPDYIVSDTLGQIRGANLFHSFTTFNIDSGESATFAGPASVENIIGRVTGGLSSSIDGALRSSIADANLYLVNPAGFVFGENATVDVSGSFYASTASNVRLGNDGSFDVTNPGDSVLSAAPPSAFGFLDNISAQIQVQGSTLEVSDGENIAIIGGEITLSDAQISAPGGEVDVVAATASGNVYLQENGISIDPALGLAAVTIDQGSEINVDESENGSDRGGAVYIKAHSLTMDGAGISVGAIEQDATGVEIDVRSTVVLSDDAEISTFSEAEADSGNIVINAASVELTDAVALETSAEDAGNGGDIVISVSDRLALSGEVEIASTTEGEGRAGDVKLTAASIDIIEEAEVVSDTEGEGSGGKVLINAGRLTLNNDAEIASDVEEEGSGGSVIINAEQIILRGDSEISSDTAGAGNGGSVLLTATEQILLQGESGLFADSGESGDSGVISLRAPRLLMNGGVITTEASGSGTGGSIDIQVDVAKLSNGALISSESSGSGNAGNISLTNMEKLQIDSASSIISETEQSDGGNILIQASDLIYIKDSEVSATVEGGAGNGGNIDIDPVFVVLNNSNISANAFGGNGGNITIISSFFLATPASQVSASSALGINGTVSINAPDTDISGTLVQLPGVFVDASQLLRKQCAVANSGSDTSTFVVAEHAGIPLAPDTYLSSVAAMNNNVVPYNKGLPIHARQLMAATIPRVACR